MRVTVVGCSGSYPGPDSCASSYLVEAEGEGVDGPRTWRILLDLGNGALGQLHRYVDPLAVDAVLLSHLHPDHCMDLCGYYVMRKYHPDGPQPQIPVWGPTDSATRMARAYDLPVDPGMTEEFDFRAYGGAVELGPFTIEAVRVDHPVEAFGLRVTADGGDRRLQRRHRPVRRARPGRVGGRPPARGGIVPRRRRQPAARAPDRPRGGTGGGPGAGRAARADPHPAVVRPGGDGGRGGLRLRRAGGPGRGRIRLRPLIGPRLRRRLGPGVVHADRDLHPVGDVELLEQPRDVSLHRGGPTGAGRERSRRC